MDKRPYKPFLVPAIAAARGDFYWELHKSITRSIERAFQIPEGELLGKPQLTREDRDFLASCNIRW